MTGSGVTPRGSDSRRFFAQLAVACCALLIVAAVGERVASGHWGVANSPVFNRGSDFGFLTFLVSLVAIAMLTALALGIAVAHLVWKRRVAARQAARQRFQSTVSVEGQGRTGGGHIIHTEL